MRTHALRSQGTTLPELQLPHTGKSQQAHTSLHDKHAHTAARPHPYYHMTELEAGARTSSMWHYTCACCISSSLYAATARANCTSTHARQI